MPLLLQRVRELFVAFRHPQHRAHRIAERHRLDHAEQILDQRGVPARKIRSASTIAADPAFRQRCSVEFFLASADGRARKSRDLRDCLEATPSGHKRFPGRKHPPTTLIELRADRFPPSPNRLPVDHADLHNAPVNSRESRQAESIYRMAPAKYPIH